MMVKQVPGLKRVLRLAVAGLGLVLPVAHRAAAEPVTAVPKLDLGRYMGAWHEVARLSNKKEKHCVSDVLVLYAVKDKVGRFQMVTSCQITNANWDSWNANGKTEKGGDGRLKISYIWPFSAKYWVLAVGPEYEWALVGSSNHKTLWVLSRAAVLPAPVLAEIESKATAEGFDLSKLIMVPRGN